MSTQILNVFSREKNDNYTSLQGSSLGGFGGRGQVPPFFSTPSPKLPPLPSLRACLLPTYSPLVNHIIIILFHPPPSLQVNAFCFLNRVSIYTQKDSLKTAACVSIGTFRLDYKNGLIMSKSANLSFQTNFMCSK